MEEYKYSKVINGFLLEYEEFMLQYKDVAKELDVDGMLFDDLVLKTIKKKLYEQCIVELKERIKDDTRQIEGYEKGLSRLF